MPTEMIGQQTQWYRLILRGGNELVLELEPEAVETLHRFFSEGVFGRITGQEWAPIGSARAQATILVGELAAMVFLPKGI